ncbi:MAG TPA: radical SAM family heme chaperone HemW [Chitinophagaceae bacterium]|nr:radical SAM family heme chaperone HemW [Chitinophagaceae bacterium]
MAGIYIHIPFCKQACYYCNFHFSTSTRLKNDFVSALLNEIKLQKSYLGEEDIETVYFGGGTPSILLINEIKKILETIYTNYRITNNPEITIEANPDDISYERLMQWKQIGINRFSIGIQSFFEEDLQWMNRAHNAKQAQICIKEVWEAGFENFSIDLIYGGPSLSDEHWQINLEKAVKLKIPHISCYALTVEPKTALNKMIQQQKKEAVDPEKQARHFLQMTNILSKAGYEHYEVSNFALPGLRSKHNSSYWLGKNYLGLGPSAHSHNGQSRQWNISNNALYIEALNKNTIPFEKEELSLTQQLNEYIMTSLRTAEGLNLNFVAEKFGEDYGEKILNACMDKKFAWGILTIQPSIVLNNKGKLFADRIASDLFFS